MPGTAQLSNTVANRGPDTLETRLKEAELQKRQLEVQGLAFEQSWKARTLKVIPFLTALVAVGGFLLGIHQNNVAREKEFKRHFWERQLESYVEASRLAASLSTLPPGQERAEASIRFRQLYHGEMVVFEDEAVMQAMRDFAQLYIDYMTDEGLQTDLQKQARAFARTCRESASRQWDVELKALDVSRY